jgi:peptidoglycan hydrolase-like protein with peptidoglycan-binding domain
MSGSVQPAINRRDDPTATDPDDWFADQPTEGRAPVVSRPEDVHPDDWLSAREAARPGARPNARALVVGTLIVILIVAGLAAAGVFSSGGGRPAVTTTTTTSTSTPPVTTTVPTTTPVAIGIAPTVTLKPGDSGAQVKLLQSALAQLGDSPGTIDGVYGTSTSTAVTEFQRAHKLTPDGILGPASLAALTAALSGG